MKRTDFLKTLGALIISPLAINSILKDKGCPPKQIRPRTFKANVTKEILPIESYATDECYNQLYKVNADLYDRHVKLVRWLTIKK